MMGCPSPWLGLTGPQCIGMQEGNLIIQPPPLIWLLDGALFAYPFPSLFTDFSIPEFHGNDISFFFLFAPGVSLPFLFVCTPPPPPLSLKHTHSLLP